MSSTLISIQDMHVIDSCFDDKFQKIRKLLLSLLSLLLFQEYSLCIHKTISMHSIFSDIGQKNSPGLDLPTGF